MLNRVWFFLLLIGILYGFGKGAYRCVYPQPNAAEAADSAAADDAQSADSPLAALKEAGKDLNVAAIDSAKISVEICLELIGIMALWLGLLKIAEDAGLVAMLARLLRPLLRWLFPEVPNGHPAQGAILMNLSANMLGLDNAATPLGLKAMRELQELNPTDDTATDSMVTFLALNTSSVTLLPFTIIGYRSIAGSEDAAGPIFPILLTTIVSTIVAIIAARTLARWPAFRWQPATAAATEGGED